MSELIYLKDHTLELLENCVDLELICLIRNLLMDNTVTVDDKAQETNAL